MQNDNKSFFIRSFILLVAIIYACRLFYLQVVDDSYIEAAEDNAIQKVVEVPFRGLIYDRKGNLIVSNTPVYDLYVTPKKVKKTIDTLAFCRLFEITPKEFKKKMDDAVFYSWQRPSLFLRQLSVEDFAKIQDQLTDYPGFSFQTSAFRKYHSTAVANAVGYVGEISPKSLEAKIEKGEDYYKQGDYIGLSGIEKYYEEYLRGTKGVKYIMKNSKGAEKGSYKDGELDQPSIAGTTLHSSIDIDLQNLADSLMQNKVGSAIAIEPSTGEILAMVSAPSYDPRMLTGRYFSKNFAKLALDVTNPLFNRPVQARYRPGSTFKTIQSLVALQKGVITANFSASHAGSPMSCTHNHPVSANVPMGLQQSCNPYYYYVFRRFMMDQNLAEENIFKRSAMNLRIWNEMVGKFGIGQKLGIDLPSEIKGLLPDVAFYDKVYKGELSWKFSNIYSMGIGEGELIVTPIKMANVAAIIANRGFYITPHIIKGIGQVGRIPKDYSIRKYVGIDRKHFEVVVDGLAKAAAPGGTVSGVAIMPELEMCGKTGTSQNRVGKDHAIFICFAPRNNPKIAIAVFVENGGFGGTASAPVASMMIEQYLKGKVSRQALKTEYMARNYSSNVLNRLGAQNKLGPSTTPTTTNSATAPITAKASITTIPKKKN